MNVLETERLVLRKITNDDSDFIIHLLNDEAFIKNIGDKKVRTSEDAIRYIKDGPVASYEKYGFGLYLVILKDSGNPIGMCGLLKRETLKDVDVGFAFLPEFRGKGYAYESASAVVKYGKKQFGLKKIVGITIPENKGSIAVLKKIGLKFEGMVKVNEDEPEIQMYAIEFNKL